jgi:hypothetical protein
MSNCPRCGAPLDPDAPRCFGCAQGVPRLLNVTRPKRTLRRNPAVAWFWGGAVIGAGIGFVGWAVFAVLEAVGMSPFGKGGILSVDALAVFALLGGMLGACAGVLWMALVRPVLLAIFASPQSFEREYGTPEEQGIVRKTEPQED